MGVLSTKIATLPKHLHRWIVKYLGYSNITVCVPLPILLPKDLEKGRHCSIHVQSRYSLPVLGPVIRAYCNASPHWWTSEILVKEYKLRGSTLPSQRFSRYASRGLMGLLRTLTRACARNVTTRALNWTSCRGVNFSQHMSEAKTTYLDSILPWSSASLEWQPAFTTLHWYWWHTEPKPFQLCSPSSYSQLYLLWAERWAPFRKFVSPLLLLTWLQVYLLFPQRKIND